MANRWPGRCHCGALEYHYFCDLDPAKWSVRACQCQFCRAHSALSTSAPDARIAFTSTKSQQLQRYRFGLQTADFLLCGNCGVYVGAVIETPRGRFGIINTRTLSPMPPELAGPAPIRYDDEDTAGRVQRREQRWSPVDQVPWD